MCFFGFPPHTDSTKYSLPTVYGGLINILFPWFNGPGLAGQTKKLLGAAKI